MVMLRNDPPGHYRALNSVNDITDEPFTFYLSQAGGGGSKAVLSLIPLSHTRIHTLTNTPNKQKVTF